MRGPIGLFGATALAATLPAPAAAQTSSRTYVAGTGNDANDCFSAAQACRSFGRAQTRTSDGGEIICLDSATYNGFTITKSITIDCRNNLSAIGASANGILIDTPGVHVIIRGLLLYGGPNSFPYNTGIYFVRGESLTVQHATISNYTNPSAGYGIHFAPVTAARLIVTDTAIHDNRAAGIFIRPTGAGYASATLENVQAFSNGGAALLLDTGQVTGSSSNVSIAGSFLASSNLGISVIGPAGAAGASVNIVDSRISGNLTAGLTVNGPNARIIASASTITGNSTGLAAINGGIIGTLGNNNLFGNGVNGAFNGFLTQN